MQKKILTVGMVIILLLNVILVGVVNAESLTKSVTVYTEGRCPTNLKYNGVDVGCVRVSYYDGKVEQPAFCLDRDAPGIGTNAGEKDFYDVQVTGEITNTLIWRVVSNSYPYVSLEELGVNLVEAFVATKQAVFCILYGNDANNFSRYEATNESGERTLNLIKKLVNNARNSNETKPSIVIDIIDKTENWEVDNIDENYISKIYSIKTEAEYSTYNVSLNSSTGLPEDTKIVNMNNQNQTSFGAGEIFKVLIPINHNIENGTFTINVTAKLRTCPVYFGDAPEGLQDYALAANPYENGSGSIKETFSKNNSKIIIIKKDAKTNELLKGTEFNILDSNKKIVYSNLITDSNGQVILNGVNPGTYYLQEVRATDGYVKLENLVKFNMELNKEITLTVNNNKVQKSEIEINTEDLTVNVEHKETNVNISTGEDNTNIMDTDVDINVSNKEINTNIQDTNLNANINNKETNTNIQDTDVNININEQETNTNVQDTTTNININKVTENNTVNSSATETVVKKLPKTGF